jgi:hypothetical protein
LMMFIVSLKLLEIFKDSIRFIVSRESVLLFI